MLLDAPDSSAQTVRPYMTTPPSFPTLAGLGWSVHKKPVFSTMVANHVSAVERFATLSIRTRSGSSN